MTDLETRLAQARKTLSLGLHGFDTAAAIAREVVAEKDAEIARLEAKVASFPWCVCGGTIGWHFGPPHN